MLRKFFLFEGSYFNMETFTDTIKAIDAFAWGPVMVALLVGTGIFLTIRLGFRTWLNLPYALKSVLSKEARTTKRGDGDISPFAALMTALAATIGTGNIVGVATALISGGPGALVWMEISAIFGLTSKFSECMLATKYRTVNEQGEMLGGPMITMKRGFKNKKFGAALAMLFAVSAVITSFGIGNLTQANSISSALNSTFRIPTWTTGVIITILVLFILIGGITRLSKVSSVIVPVMAVFYLFFGLIVILGNITNLPSAVVLMFRCAFSPQAVSGGALGTIVSGMMQSMRWGVARGVFSNEAGMGSAAITASAAMTDDPVRQGYISMTGTFFDTIVICTVTGLAICSSGVLGSVDPATGELITGSALTIAAFETVLGTFGKWMVTIGIALFAFSTILGWEYNGEKALEYIVKSPKAGVAYRIIFSLIAFVGATQPLDLVWSFADIANALMILPNLVCLLALSGVAAKEVKRFQPIIDAQKRRCTNLADRSNRLHPVLDAQEGGK
jgi:AGCS family alanine or glycine:cation symporter